MVKKTLEPKLCLHCGADFQPKRRFVQKYCGESCRVMACQQRKKGISGTLLDKPKSKSVTDLYHRQQEMLEPVKEMVQEMGKILANLNLCVQETMVMTHKIQLSQDPSTIRDIGQKVSDLSNSGLTKLPEQLRKVELSLLKIELTSTNILKSQDRDLWITVLSSMFGPILGENIWEGIKGLVTGNKELSTEDQIAAILKAVNNLVNKKQ